MDGKELMDMGYAQGPAIGHAISYAKTQEAKNVSQKKIFKKLQKVLKNPNLYKADHDENLRNVANALLPKDQYKGYITPKINQSPCEINIWGRENIEDGAVDQIYKAAKLPIARKAALMPDGHQGYGLPIGGVLACENAVIPYGVGVDIACRMSMSVLPVDPSYLDSHSGRLRNLILQHTAFGPGRGPAKVLDDPLFESDLFNTVPKIRELRDTAMSQIGSSGGGNHFVEWGVVTFEEDDPALGVSAGSYMAILTHSGSRGFGAKLAQHYTKVAQQTCRMDGHYKALAWLDLDSENGQEYWAAMNLAGEYAKACHEHIHRKLVKGYGVKPIAQVENHHNFAWKEVHDGVEYVVHRKGATPAGSGQYGIIPGSMTKPGYLVRGKGEASSLQSASHGAGRVMSRKVAKENITSSTIKKQLEAAGVTLLGAGLDEAPDAYKDIDTVISAQRDLVDVIAKFEPKIVRMDGDPDKMLDLPEQPGM